MYRPLVGLLRSVLIAAALCAPLAVAAAPGLQPDSALSSIRQPGQIFVRFQPDAAPSDVARILATYPIVEQTSDIYHLNVKEGEVEAALTDLRAEPSVAYALRREIVAVKLPAAQTKRAGAPVRPAAQPALASEAATMSAPGPDVVVETGAAGKGDALAVTTAVTRVWASDTPRGAPPAGNEYDAGECGLRFNAKTRIHVNVAWENLAEQQVRIRLYSLGLESTEIEMPGIVVGGPAIARGTGSATWPLDMVTLPVGCYEARVASSDTSTPLPLPVRFQIVTAPMEDTFYPRDLWQHDHTRAYDGDPTADIKASGAWNITTGAEDTIIAVISTGIDTTHPEFVGRLVPGYDFIRNRPDPSDDFGYGTFLAGLLAANARNEKSNDEPCGERCDMVGVNWGTKIMPLKVSAMIDTPNGREFQSTADAIIQAINYAWKHGARVILVSLPIDPNTVELETQQALRYEVTQALNANALVVAPVWDVRGGGAPDTRLLPAALPGGQILAVTATDELDRHWSEALTGDYVSLAAPGRTYLYSTNIPGSVWCPGCLVDPDVADGDTAIAAAQVAGVAGLIWSVNPTLKPLVVQQILKNSADKVDLASHPVDDTGRNDALGYGRVNAERALWHTPHALQGAFRPRMLSTTRTGVQCTRVENTRTGAITWTAHPAPADDDWVDVYGPFSKNGSRTRPDYQGDLPSYVEVCVNVGTGPGQRPPGLIHFPRLIVRSTMPEAVSREIEVEVPIDTITRPYAQYLPALQASGEPPVD